MALRIWFWAILDKEVAVVDIDITSAMHVQHGTKRYLAFLGATERAQDVCSRPDRTLRLREAGSRQAFV